MNINDFAPEYKNIQTEFVLAPGEKGHFGSGEKGQLSVG
jgi:hypothetical protein